LVGFPIIFFTFAYLKNNAALDRISSRLQRVPLAPDLLALHFLAMAAFGGLSWALYGHRVPNPDVAAAFWLAAGAYAIAFGALAAIPLRLWRRLVHDTGWLWSYAFLAVVAACVAGNYSQQLWMPTAHLTFLLVRSALSLFVPGVIADQATMTLGTAKFSVVIAPQCSGLEGAGLILAFGAVWLWLFRRECRFPQALVLIPGGVAAIFLLNAARIACLILIGNAGAEQIAVGGFHSQAGWIAFNAVALGLSVAARRIPWIAKRQPQAAHQFREGSSVNPTATYLLPFLSILAAGMITAAASGDFEWLYPVLFAAAGGVLWILRKKYASLNWKVSWFGPAMGASVFIVWIALDAFLNASAGNAMPHALADSSAPARITWIAFRALAAIVTVPLAEELAFRGFLLRRFISPDFDALPLHSFTWLGLGISSLAFGLLHGNLWFAGILAGLLYAWALMRRGSIGEAVVAHATTNAMLAVYVLVFHKWHLWL